MNKVAIVVWTEYGQTIKIAHEMMHRLNDQGIQVQILNLRWGIHPRLDLTAFDTVLIGGPIYAGKFPRVLIDWIEKHLSLLTTKRIGFFSVSLNAASLRAEAREADDRMLRSVLTETGLIPQFVASFAGAIHYRKYGLLKRWTMRKISAANGGPTDTSKDHELTNWSDVSAFLTALILDDQDSRFAYQNRLGSTSVSQSAGLAGRVPKTLPS